MEFNDRAKEAATVQLDHTDNPDKKVHPWRKCGRGKHLVREHIVHVPPSNKHPDGMDSVRHEHCANNPSGKDELSYAEIKYISTTYFPGLIGPPTSDVLVKIFPDADKYDVDIRGWTRYWNDIFQLDEPLDPNVVKALIATESSFDPKPKTHAYVYGLMQITGQTHQFLCGEKHELRDHYICVSATELIDASANICAGVRWLFRKIETASSLLQRKASWEETVEDYKAILELRIHDKPYNPKPMEDFRKYYKILSKE